MKKVSKCIIIVSVLIILTSCTKELTTNNDSFYEEKIPNDEDLSASEEKIEHVPEGYFLRENVYRNMEYSEDKIYIKYEWANPNDKDDWNDALWCFSPYEDGKRIAEGKGLDFRVSKNSDYIAIEIDGKIDFYNKKGELLQSISNHILNTERNKNVKLEEWNVAGDTLWCSLKEAYNVYAYITIETNTWEIGKYNERNFSSDEYVLNPNTGWVAYSDYPVMFDNIAFDEYEESKEITTLFIYNLITKEEIIIDAFETNRFQPMWTNDNEVMYYTGDRVNFYTLQEN